MIVKVQDARDRFAFWRLFGLQLRKLANFCIREVIPNERFALNIQKSNAASMLTKGASGLHGVLNIFNCNLTD